MVTETVTPTREELETEAANKLAEVKAAEKLVTSAMKQFESSVGQVPMEQLLELGRAVDKAKTDAEDATKLAKRAQERVDGFEMEAKAEGGESRVDSDMGNVIGAAASGVASSADAILTQSAFDQTITQGANIQFNSNTMQVAGNDLTDDHHLGG